MMHRIFAFGAFLGLLVQSVHGQEVQQKTPAPAEVQTKTNSLEKASSGTWEKLVMQPFLNDKGQVIAELPLPATWTVITGAKRGEPGIVGPHKVKVIDFPAQNFTFTRDPNLKRIYTQSGTRLRPLPTIENLIRQDLVPWASGQGLTLVKHYEIPEITRIDKWYNEQLYKVEPMQSDVVAFGIDWQHQESGNRFFMILHRVAGETPQMLTWYYYSTGLQAEKAHFDVARKQLIFALANARYNMEQIAAFNRSEADKAGRSWAAHNQRLAQNQAAFEASQRAFVNRSTAAHDALMSGWKERNAASDKSHERFVDTITERQNVINPTTGTRYKVEAGQNQYWMNRDGKYISVDNPSYDPNLDKALNHQTWDELKKVD